MELQFMCCHTRCSNTHVSCDAFIFLQSLGCLASMRRLDESATSARYNRMKGLYVLIDFYWPLHLSNFLNQRPAVADYC